MRLWVRNVGVTVRVTIAGARDVVFGKPRFGSSGSQATGFHHSESDACFGDRFSNSVLRDYP